jgi:hypothetical protein
MPENEKCSNWAENLTTDSSRYSKNLFLSRTAKKLSHKMCFQFLNISDSALL